MNVIEFPGLDRGPTEVAQALADLAAHAPLTEVPTARIEAALRRTRADIPAQALVDALKVTFRRVTSNSGAARFALDELSRRNDERAELAFIAHLGSALEGDESGHRPHEDTVFDFLIETALPRFSPAAIAALLPHLDATHLSVDGFGKLIEPALHAAKGEVRVELETALLGEIRYTARATIAEAQRKQLEAEIVGGTLDVRGDPEIFRALHAKVLGAGFSEQVMRDYVRQCAFVRNTDFDVRALVWALATANLSALREAVRSWAAQSSHDVYARRNLVSLLSHSSRRDDESSQYENSPLLQAFAELANEIEPIDAHQELEARIGIVVGSIPTREERARHWLAQASKPVKVDALTVTRLITKLGLIERDEAVLAWHTLLGKIDRFNREAEVAPVVILAAARLGHEDMVEALGGLVGQPTRAQAEVLLHVQRGDVSAASKAYRVYAEAGGELACNPGEADRPWLEAALRQLPGLANEVRACRETLERAAFEGVDVTWRPGRQGAFIETTTDEQAVAQFVSSDLSRAYRRMCLEAPRAQRSVLDALISKRHAVASSGSGSLSSVMRRLRLRGNTSAVIAWLSALEWLPGDDLEEILAEGLVASRLRRETPEAEWLAFVPTSPTSAALCLELARLDARAGRTADAMTRVGQALALARSAPEIISALRNAAADPDLRDVAPAIEALL